LEAFERACKANGVREERVMDLVPSYIKGTALTWFNQGGARVWRDNLRPR